MPKKQYIVKISYSRLRYIGACGPFIDRMKRAIGTRWDSDSLQFALNQESAIVISNLLEATITETLLSWASRIFRDKGMEYPPDSLENSLKSKVQILYTKLEKLRGEYYGYSLSVKKTKREQNIYNKKVEKLIMKMHENAARACYPFVMKRIRKLMSDKKYVLPYGVEVIEVKPEEVKDGENAVQTSSTV